MKKDGVPQDDARLLNGMREVQYAVDENGKYVQVLSRGWDPKNAALQHALDTHSERAEEARAEVLAGRLSPLGFHMARTMMDPSLLSQYAGVPRRRIKKLLTPQGWAKAEPAVLEALASALGLTVALLRELP